MSSTDIIVRQFHRTTDLLERIVEQLGAQASAPTPSSVEIKTSARGVDVGVKAYVGSDVREAGDAAVDEYFRVCSEIERRLSDRAA